MAIQRGTTWQANVRLLNGKRLRPGGFTSEAEAELWEAQARAADVRGEPIPAPLTRRVSTAALPGAITLGDLRKKVLQTPYRDGWKGSKDEDGASERSHQVVTFYGANKPAHEIDVNEVDRLVTACVAAGNSAATINRKLAALSKMLNFAVKRGLLRSVPHIARQEEYEGRIRFLTRDEEASILSAMELMGWHDERLLTIFLIDTGARYSEAVETLTHADVGNTATFWETKGGKARTVPLTARARAACTRFARNGLAGPFSGFNYWTYRDRFERARKNAGLGDDVIIHVLRHTCASRLVQAGWDVRRVQIWMGHKAITTTLRYAHLAPDALDGMAASLEAPVDKRTVSAVEAGPATVTELVPKRAQLYPARSKVA